MKFQVISQSNMKYAKEIFENKFMALEIAPPPIPGHKNIERKG